MNTGNAAAPSPPALSGEAEEVVKELRAAHEYWRNRDYLEGSGVLFDTAASLIERQARDDGSTILRDQIDDLIVRLNKSDTACARLSRELAEARAALKEIIELPARDERMGMPTLADAVRIASRNHALKTRTESVKL